MRLEDRLTENQRSLAAFASGSATAGPLYCICASPLCSDSVVVTAAEALAAEQAGYRITSLAHAPLDGGEIVTRTVRYAGVR